jgi:VCBS repeat-containing protein
MLAVIPQLHAAITDYRILIDADHDAATGCTVSSMTGVDHVLVTRVETTSTAGTITRTFRRVCSAGSLGSEIELASGWDTGYVPASGQMLVETSIPFDVFGTTLPTMMRFGVEAQQGSIFHRAFDLPGGTPALFPVPRRRRAVAAPGAPRVITLDGDGSDWTGIAPLFNGIASGGSPGLRMIQLFAHADVERDLFFFRIDANISTDVPFATDDEYERQQGEPALSVPAPGVLANDGDPSGLPLTATQITPASHGEVTLNPDGSLTYTPNDPGSSTVDSFRYRATNGVKQSNLAHVRISVTTSPSTAPDAADDAYATDEDETLNVATPGVLANDTDPNGDPLTAALLAPPAHGTVVLNANGGFTYTPADDYFGGDSFTYTVSDGTNTDTATVTITIGSVNDAPRLEPRTFTIPENTPAGTQVGDLDASDVDVADNHVYSIIDGNVGNAFSISSSTGRITVANAAALDFEVTPQFTLTIRVRDNGSPQRGDSAAVTINLTDVNEAPTVTGSAHTTAEDTALNVAAPGVLAGANDPEGAPLTAQLVTGTTNGTLTLAPDGSFDYTPNADPQSRSR